MKTKKTVNPSTDKVKAPSDCQYELTCVYEALGVISEVLIPGTIPSESCATGRIKIDRDGIENGVSYLITLLSDRILEISNDLDNFQIIEND